MAYSAVELHVHRARVAKGTVPLYRFRTWAESWPVRIVGPGRFFDVCYPSCQGSATVRWAPGGYATLYNGRPCVCG